MLMKNKLRLFIINSQLVLFGIGFAVQAQHTVPATGGIATGSGGKVSYTIGQIDYYKNAGASGVITQGVQQHYEIIVITTAKQAKEISLVCSVYPNPTNGFLKLILKGYKSENLTYQIYNINGELITSEVVRGNETSISIGNSMTGIYFLKVSDNQKEIKTFKIIKE